MFHGLWLFYCSEWQATENLWYELSSHWRLFTRTYVTSCVSESLQVLSKNTTGKRKGRLQLLHVNWVRNWNYWLFLESGVFEAWKYWMRRNFINRNNSWYLVCLFDSTDYNKNGVYCQRSWSQWLQGTLQKSVSGGFYVLVLCTCLHHISAYPLLPLLLHTAHIRIITL